MSVYFPNVCNFSRDRKILFLLLLFLYNGNFVRMLITVSLHMQSHKFKNKLKKRVAASPRIRFKYAEVVSANEARLRLRVAVRGWSLHNDRISILVGRDTGENELQLILSHESFSFFNFNLKNSKDAIGENARLGDWLSHSSSTDSNNANLW